VDTRLGRCFSGQLGGLSVRLAPAVEILDRTHIGVDDRLPMCVVELAPREAIPLDPAGQATLGYLVNSLVMLKVKHRDREGWEKFW
jgi:hypothetical protein